MMVEVYETMPEGFDTSIQVAAIWVRVEEKFLFLELSPLKEEKGFWGLPAGKFEVGEEIFCCAQRELFEETGIQGPLSFLKTLYIRKPHIDYAFHLFEMVLSKVPLVKLSKEHQSYRWATLEEAKKLPLMQGGQEALEFYAKQVSQ